MEIVSYSLADIALAMVDFDGTLFCSTPQLCEVFQTTPQSLWQIANERRGEFSNARLTILTSMNHCRKPILEAFKLERSRPNTRIWTEDDVLSFTFFLRSDIAKSCRAQFKEILKAHAKRNYLSPEQVDLLVQTDIHPFAEQIRYLSAEVDKVKELHGIVDSAASNAGKFLRNIRSIRH